MDESTIDRFILLTDIARSSYLAETFPEQYFAALQQHNHLVISAVERHGGEVLKCLGDGFLALFEDAVQAVDAAIELQAALGTGSKAGIPAFPDGSSLGVRTVVHGGKLTRLAGQAADWFGSSLNRAARICKVCHPGQLLISSAVRRALPALPAGVEELDLGRVRLRDLGEPEELYQLTHRRFAQRQFPPLLDLDSRPNNLAAQPNLFIGRDRELAELARLLDGPTRLLTLHAPGGYGKSRLAGQLCAYTLWRFEHGAFEVQLAQLRDHRYLPEAIAGAAGFRFTGSSEPRVQILKYLRHKEMLLYLDNFEHLLEGADFIAEILRNAPKLRILVTSREPLRLTAEHVYGLEPLPCGPGSDSVQLFADRAGLVKHGFTLNDQTAPWIERICERLEGIPLSIELIAAWADQIALPDMYAELGHQLELTARMRDVPARQRSIRASFDWSYQLLAPHLQMALRTLAIFRGGFAQEAAQAVLGGKGKALQQVLAELGDKSWLYRREPSLGAMDGGSVIARYFLRDTASQEYALGLLNEPENNEERAKAEIGHAAHYAALVAQHGPDLKGAGQPDRGKAQLEALQLFAIEQSNILAALDTAAVLGQADWLLPLAQHCWRYQDVTGAFASARELYLRMLKAAGELGNSELELHVQLGLARISYKLADFTAARAAASRAASLAEELESPADMAQAYTNLASVESALARPAAAAELLEKALAIRRKSADHYGEASSLYNLAFIKLAEGEYLTAREMLQQSLALQRSFGDLYAEASCLFALGNVGYMLEELDEAQKHFEQAVKLQRGIGDRSGEATSWSNLGNIQGALGHVPEAQAHFEQALLLQREIGDHLGAAYSLANLGATARVRENCEEAGNLYRQALALAKEIGAPVLEAYCSQELGNAEFMLDRFDASRQHYEDVLPLRGELDDRQGEAFARIGLANAHYMLGNYPAAQQLYTHALADLKESGGKQGLLDCCACASALLCALGRAQQAASAHYAALSGAAAANCQFAPETQKMIDAAAAGLEEAAAAGNLTAEMMDSLKRAGESLGWDELPDFLLGALAAEEPQAGPGYLAAGG